MSVYQYSAKDLQGEYHKGEVEAIDDRQVAGLLRRKKLIVISIKPKIDQGVNFLEKLFSRISFGEVVIITRQLATMIEAGLVLSEALDILVEQQTNKRLKKALTEISTQVKGGVDFASAVEKYPDIFPPLYSRLIRAGQASGKLDTILLELATNLEKEREFRAKVKGAMIYPVVVVTMMIGVMLVMIFFVMPKLMGLYKESGIELPLPTQIMIGFADFMFNFWWAIVFVIVAIVISVKRYLATAEGRVVFDRLILKLPIVGRISSLVILTNFTRTLALLVSSGIPLLDSIKILSDIVGNEVYKGALDLAYKGVERGLPLSNQLLSFAVFPRLVGQMIRTGEETGKLDDVMSRLAEYFEAESDNSLKNVTTLIEPVVLVILGIGVGLLVISVILPIYQLTTSIK